ncbi:MAG TPA: TRAP transporter large permease subunit, partial [Burkholderiales bacterium]|nr:TRAP transporter large permease subunit [Burkholderiales bacterium]
MPRAPRNRSRTLTLRGLFDAFLDTVHSTAMLFFIIVGAFIFSRFIVLTQLPGELGAWVKQAGLAPGWVLLGVMALYLL